MLGDLEKPGDRMRIARGGNGGFGNAYFKSSTNQAPRRVNPGQPAEELTIWLHLKLIADAGLVGLPNAGKSTFLCRRERCESKDRRLSIHDVAIRISASCVLASKISCSPIFQV